MGLFDDLWAGTAEVVDRGAGVVVGTGTVLGGVVLTGATEGSKLLNDASFGLGFKTEEEHEATEAILDQTQEFGKGAAAGGSLQVVNAVTTPVDLDERLESSDGFWDLFFQDTADGLGTSLTLGTVLADTERTGESPSTEDLERRREAVAGWEDEILATVFTGVPLLMFPKLRLLLAAATPMAFSAVSNAIQTGSGVGNDILQSFMVALDLVLDDDEESSESEDVKSEESEDESEIVEDEEEAVVVKETPTGDDVVQEVDEVVAEPFYASMGLDDSNMFVEREIFY